MLLHNQVGSVENGRLLGFRVLMVFEVYYPVLGGIQTWISEVVPRLTGHQVTLLTANLDASVHGFEVNYENPKICRIGKKAISSVLMRRGYYSLFRSLWIPQAAYWIRKHISNYDLVYAHVQASEVASIIGAYPTKPVIWHYHGTNHAAMYELFGVRKAILFEFFEHLGAKLPCDGCVTTDDYTKRLMLTHFRATRPTVTIRNGIDANKFRPTHSPVNGFIFTARRLVRKNGLQFLIPAMETVVRSHPRTQLSIAGDGPMKDELAAIITGLGLQDHVKLLGRVSHDELVRLYNDAEFVVLPSLTEGIPLTCLEAMACGRPVLATSVGGVPEIIAPRTGFLIPPQTGEGLIRELASQISLMLNDPEMTRRAGRAARGHVLARFTWEHTANSVNELLRGFD